MTHGTNPAGERRNLSLWTGTIARAAYFVSGTSLLAIKFGVDRSVASLFRHEWSPLEYIAPDEYVEATPKSLRLRKKILDATSRKRSAPKVN